jgi:predicted CXXCH cytochrome family protein
MGSKYRQRYIIQTAEGGYQVLPGQWNVDSATWVEAAPGDWLNDCAGCHTTGYDPVAKTWSELSIGCEACHGPGSVHLQKISSGDVEGAVASIVKTVDAAVCGQCHTRGQSPSGYAYPEGYVVGGALDVAMFAPSLPVEGGNDDWWPDGTERQYREQYMAWSISKHGRALADLKSGGHAADSCLACHSTDFNRQTEAAPVTLDNAQFSITCVQCHAPHGEAATEKQLTAESYELCTGCHNATGGGERPITAGSEVHHPMQEMFEGSPFLDLQGDPSFHFENPNGPVCASCHMVGTAQSGHYSDSPTHTWQIIKPTGAAEGQPDSCTGCHVPERDPDNAPENLTAFLDAVQADTQDRVAMIHEDLDPVLEAHPEWDPAAEDKSEEQVTAETIVTLVSFVESDGSWGFHNPDYTDEILTEAEDLLDQLSMGR